MWLVVYLFYVQGLDVRPGLDSVPGLDSGQGLDHVPGLASVPGVRLCARVKRISYHYTTSSPLTIKVNIVGRCVSHGFNVEFLGIRFKSCCNLKR